ncbi:roadblock/LC7 domain-containing protein [Kangiella sediminilitoris]|uniref:Roadblock/LAMTOR2 domain-containing protein n=1 Tax=Kangiella sediminilitoris TaxID=1144748 RepID=A0A1B3B8K5_9GAMM|nr:roadblock/LC7 domain-containing protein [Kangiella sediminilitoris]AOE49138.1 hypothetical protein KS2013_414 [Kangiella sediminilitoris]
MNKQHLENTFDVFINKYFDLEMISLCTADGFGILHKSKGKSDVELDRLSAITSSLVSLGDASSNQVIGGALNSTIVETDNGNLLIKKITMADKPLVLSIVTSKKMLLGEANYLIGQCEKRLSASF